MGWINRFLGIAVLVLTGCGEESAPPPTATVCEPFEKQCSEDGVPQSANALGTGYLPSEACESGFTCESGECVGENSSEGGEETDAVVEEESDASESCTLNADCEAEYSGQPCVNAVCEKGECIPSAVDDGQSCPDGICLEGECIPTICEQGETVCAADAGKTGGGLYTCGPLGTEFVKQADCDDGDACNGSEYCEAGVCLDGEELDCEDGNPCTLDDCETVPGCVYEEVIGPCEDGSACTVGDGCINGSCVGVWESAVTMVICARWIPAMMEAAASMRRFRKGTPVMMAMHAPWVKPAHQASAPEVQMPIAQRATTIHAWCLTAHRNKVLDTSAGSQRVGVFGWAVVYGD